MKRALLCIFAVLYETSRYFSSVIFFVSEFSPIVRR